MGDDQDFEKDRLKSQIIGGGLFSFSQQELQRKKIRLGNLRGPIVERLKNDIKRIEEEEEKSNRDSKRKFNLDLKLPESREIKAYAELPRSKFDVNLFDQTSPLKKHEKINSKF